MPFSHIYSKLFIDKGECFFAYCILYEYSAVTYIIMPNKSLGLSSFFVTLIAKFLSLNQKELVKFKFIITKYHD